MAEVINKKVLIIVDAQNDFITGALKNDVADERVPNIVKLVNKGGWDNIFLTKDTHEAETYMTSKEGQKLPAPHCIYGSEGWEIDNRVKEAVQNYVNTHTEVKAMTVLKPIFGSVQLVNTLAEVIGVDSDNVINLDITMCGFCTDICVVSNALIIRAGLPNKVDISVVADACAGTTPENHEAALKTMTSCQCNIINSVDKL